jgi:hypothetical protein
MTRVSFLVVLLAALAISGCGAKSDRAGGSAGNKPRPRSTAALAIVAPEPGAVVSGDSGHVRLSLSGATLTFQTSPNIVPDEGHIHLKLDGRLVSMTGALDQDVPVVKGPHLLEAEFVANDHLPFDPRVITTVTFVAP